jgi:RNA polymerase sigma factor (sigma-70 family)
MIAQLAGFSRSRPVPQGKARAVSEVDRKARCFEQTLMPHLDSAYNLARWLTRSDADAQDVVQEACLRAFKYFDGFDGQYANAWLLKIVRNTCFSWLKKNRPAEESIALEDKAEDVEQSETAIFLNESGLGRSPEASLIASRDASRLNELIETMPPLFREVIILRELEEMSYRDIADVTGVPIGTVMSRLARGRKLLQSAWYASKPRSNAP